MIRLPLQRFVLIALLCAAGALSGCVSIQTGSGGRVTYWVVPGLESGDQTNRAGTTYYNQRWGSSPDTHPAVAGRPPQTSREETERVGVRTPGAAGATSGTASDDASGDAPKNGSGSGSQANVPRQQQQPPYVPYPPYSTRTSREAREEGQVTGALIGGLIGTQAGNRLGGVAMGAAVGALAGGKMADPCQSNANAGSLWGAIAGGWLGSLFGGGRAREFFTALGAAGGAVRGTEYDGGGRGCR